MTSGKSDKARGDLFASTEVVVMTPSLAHVPGPAAGVTPRANHCGIPQSLVQRPLLTTGREGPASPRSTRWRPNIAPKWRRTAARAEIVRYPVDVDAFWSNVCEHGVAALELRDHGLSHRDRRCLTSNHLP
jgi:hypothetical protein